MPIEVVCPGCQRRLRVPDRTAGKRVKCPKCEGVINVPDPSAGLSGTLPDSWFFKSEEGEDFGPVPKRDLDAWHKEGRITADCQVLREGAEQWQWATELYPELEAAAAPAPASAMAGGAAPNPFDFAAGASGPGPAPGGFAPDMAGKGAYGGGPAAAGGLSDKKKMTAGLLGIFLGGWGVHRFYLGYTGIGIAQICVTFFTCGVGAWWGIIEGIMILAGNINTDARGRALQQ